MPEPAGSEIRVTVGTPLPGLSSRRSTHARSASPTCGPSSMTGPWAHSCSGIAAPGCRGGSLPKIAPWLSNTWIQGGSVSSMLASASETVTQSAGGVQSATFGWGVADGEPQAAAAAATQASSRRRIARPSRRRDGADRTAPEGADPEPHPAQCEGAEAPGVHEREDVPPRLHAYRHECDEECGAGREPESPGGSRRKHPRLVRRDREEHRSDNVREHSEDPGVPRGYEPEDPRVLREEQDPGDPYRR